MLAFVTHMLHFGYSQLLLHNYSNLAVFHRKGETVMLTCQFVEGVLQNFAQIFNKKTFDISGLQWF